MRLALIVAMDQQGVIGLNNDLPWKLSADLQYFRQVTMGKPLIMGRNTHESIGRPLPGRLNIIVTHQENYQATGCVVVTSLELALQHCADAEEVMVMGGASLYAQLLPKVQRLYITQVHARVKGDTWFPEINRQQWQLIQQQAHSADSKNEYNFSFEVYDRL